MKAEFYIIVAQPYDNEKCRLYVTEQWSLLPLMSHSKSFYGNKKTSEVIRQLEEKYPTGWYFHREKIDFSNEFELLYAQVQSESDDNTTSIVENQIAKLTFHIRQSIIEGKLSYCWKTSMFSDDDFVIDSVGLNCKFTEMGKQVIQHFKDQGLTVSEPKFGHDGAGVKSWNTITFKGWAE